jgi:hypothetical protein
LDANQFAIVNAQSFLYYLALPVDHGKRAPLQAGDLACYLPFIARRICVWGNLVENKLALFLNKHKGVAKHKAEISPWAIAFTVGQIIAKNA